MFCGILKTLSILTPTFLTIIIALTSVLVGGTMPLVERKYLSLIQRRVGPNQVGLNGRLQFVADALKLLVKETIYIKNTNRGVLVSLPLLFLNINMLFMVTIIWGNNQAFVPVEYSLILFFVVLSLSNLIIIFTGFVLKNKYTQISSIRAANIAINVDLLMGLCVILLVAMTSSLNFDMLLAMNNYIYVLLTITTSAVALVFIFLMDTGRAPFDLVEAETEIIMGFHSEYSGFLFVIYLLGEYLHIFIFSYLMALILL